MGRRRVGRSDWRRRRRRRRQQQQQQPVGRQQSRRLRVGRRGIGGHATGRPGAARARPAGLAWKSRARTKLLRLNQLTWLELCRSGQNWSEKTNRSRPLNGSARPPHTALGLGTAECATAKHGRPAVARNTMGPRAQWDRKRGQEQEAESIMKCVQIEWSSSATTWYADVGQPLFGPNGRQQQWAGGH